MVGSRGRFNGLFHFLLIVYYSIEIDGSVLSLPHSMPRTW